ncbi:hypothetical protein V6N12_072667 [Hibiscus sabdariffa]|uniref:Aminotransferase class I/classII large domain-containing protein n=1 Tax=Hibiscus sabdariffa TaxID=183260 RepID=A0ABR2BJS1_9ROSI
MENGTVNHEMETASTITIKGILSVLMQNVDENNCKRLISLGMGDPTLYSCFHTSHVAAEAVVEALQSDQFNGYSPTVGLPQTRRAIAEYLSCDLAYKLSSDDVFVTSGCTQAIDVALAMLARPAANILIPRPGFPIYELCATFRHLEIRYFNLLPEKGWEVDLDLVEALADQNTVGIVIINPGNPCGNVYSYQHLKKIAETAEKLKIPVVADEVYGHLVLGDNPFVPMGVFGPIVPVLTLGSLSKRWIVPGWRLAVPRIIEQTGEGFFQKIINTLKQTLDICWDLIKEIPCITCPHKPQGSMAVMIKLNVSGLEDIGDDIDFCFRLAKEESVIILPGTAVGLKNWVRITFIADPHSLKEALGRLKTFCKRHSKPMLQPY